MILRCRCGEQYTVKDEPVKMGQTMECEECGSAISIPDLHGVLMEDHERLPPKELPQGPPGEPESEPTSAQSSDLVNSLQEEVERLGEINSGLKLRTDELERKLAEVSEAGATAEPNKQLDNRNQKITQLEKDLLTTREEIATLVANRESQLNERDMRIAELSSDLDRAYETRSKGTSELGEELKRSEERITVLERDLATASEELDGEQAAQKAESREHDERYAMLERDFTYTQDQLTQVTTDRDQSVAAATLAARAATKLRW